MSWAALAAICAGCAGAVGVAPARTIGRFDRGRAFLSLGLARRWGPPAAAAAGVIGVIGRAWAMPVAIVVAIWLDRVLRRRATPGLRGGETPQDHDDLAVAAVLLAAVLESGAPVRVAAAAVGGAVAPPLRDLLRRGAAASALGVPARIAWEPLGALSPLAAHLAAVLADAEASGLPPVPALRALAVRADAAQRASARERAHRAGVRVVAPLGLCFLPAFVLVGIAPVAAGAFHSLG